MAIVLSIAQVLIVVRMKGIAYEEKITIEETFNMFSYGMPL